MNVILKISPVLGITLALGVYWYMANNSTAPHVPLALKPQAPAEHKTVQPVVPAAPSEHSAESLMGSRSWADVLSHDLPAARHGDGEAAYRIYEIAQDCIGTGQPPRVQQLAEKITHPKIPQAMRDKMALELRQCAGVDTLLAGQDDPNDWLKLAASEGQREAELSVMTECPELEISLASCLGYLHRFLDVGLTPSSLGTLFYRFGDRSLAEDGASVTFAGLLANCETGTIDCSQDSAAMQIFCQDGVCPRVADVRQAIRQRLDESSYQAVSDYAKHLIDITRSHDIYSEVEIVDIEAQIRRHDQEMRAH
ncbi:hypothetical protein [Silvimonas sp.]|uniref:hypothetical protein n=1 Tax=Silvimonas sp. TaxID=2650811 RepID=UPI00284A1470|nr:hypothetical protein [Silvimonas sp.]MDR3427742.1 hypothetical protein [Silvimonas sp.]